MAKLIQPPRWRADWRGCGELPRLIRAAGLRWPTAEGFQFSKGRFGLDQSQVRLYSAIARDTVLVMAALAICAITTALLQRRTDTRQPPGAQRVGARRYGRKGQGPAVRDARGRLDGRCLSLFLCRMPRRAGRRRLAGAGEGGALFRPPGRGGRRAPGRRVAAPPRPVGRAVRGVWR